MKGILAIAAVGSLCWPGLSMAHHSHAAFDETPGHEVTLVDATVQEFQWSNPHVWLKLAVLDPATGELQSWDIIGGPPFILSRIGWNHRTFRIGDKGSFTIHPLRTGAHGGAFEKATVNGKELVAEYSATP